MKKVGIMQPYFVPYIGYFQLIDAVDEFVIYDNIQYTKKGWINRNRILQNGEPKYITLSLEKDSDYLDVADRRLAKSFDRKKMYDKIKMAYKKAPYYAEVEEMIEKIIFYQTDHLFEYIYNSVREICRYLEIETPIYVSSTLNYDNHLKGQDKVLAICKERNADIYINAIGGMKLYHKKAFEEENMKLLFIKPQLEVYHQFQNEFQEAMSIIDCMVFNSKDKLMQMIKKYTLIEGELE